MIGSIVLAAAAFVAPSTGGLSAEPKAPEAFSFVAIGDMPYRPEDYEKVDRLIEAINASEPAFMVHVGDIISGRTLCSDENLERSASQLARISAALVYTPGDNEWTDCHRPLGGRFDPVERLSKVRRLMFPEPGRTLGRKPLTVETQALLMPAFADYRENVRFVKNGVHFVTAHVVGSNNNFDPDRAGAVDEFTRRNSANVAWIDHAFARAVEEDAKAVVIAWQANVHPAVATPKSSEAFKDMISSVERGASRFRRPILIVYGDYHDFMVSRFNNVDGRPIHGVTKMMVYGDTHVHAVRVTVDPNSPGVFGFIPLIVRENGSP